MHLNPDAPVYYPSRLAPPPPPPPPPHHIPTYIYYFPSHPPFPFVPYAGMPLPATRDRSDVKKGKQLWLPKKTHEKPSRFLSASPVVPHLLPTAPPQLEFRMAGHELPKGGITTIMIKNIPNKLTRELLIEMLDEHCAQQLRRLETVQEEKKCVLSEYDFVYLPIDFSTRANKGYAFVNFTTAEAARKAYDNMHHRKWVVFSTKKVARICFARVQGKTALVSRFMCTQFRCDTDEYLPATFTPPRNGTTSFTPPNIVGRRTIHLP